MKKLLSLSLSVLLLVAPAFLSGVVAVTTFDTGSTLHQCVINCRAIHRGRPDWVPGKWRGKCWRECRIAHPAAGSGGGYVRGGRRGGVVGEGYGRRRGHGYGRPGHHGQGHHGQGGHHGQANSHGNNVPL